MKANRSRQTGFALMTALMACAFIAFLVSVSRRDNLCEILARPENYDGKYVRIVGFPSLAGATHSAALTPIWCKTPRRLHGITVSPPYGSLNDSVTSASGGHVFLDYRQFLDYKNKIYTPAVLFTGTLKVDRYEGDVVMLSLQSGKITDLGYLDVSEPESKDRNWVWSRMSTTVTAKQIHPGYQ